MADPDAGSAAQETSSSPKAPFMLAVLLGVLSAAGPLSTDMYLPSLPTISAVFGADVGQTQLTLSAFLIGFAVGQLFVGPMADRYGRRPILIAGFTLYVVASVASLFVFSIEGLIGARFVQAMGASAGAAVTRAVVRDLFAPQQAARMLSHMGTIMGFVPAAAPIAGGAILVAFGWRANFVAMTIFGVLSILVTLTMLKETLRDPDPLATNPFRIIGNFKRMLVHPQYLGCALAGAFAFCGLFAFISGSPFVLIGIFGVAEQNFGYYFAGPVVGYIIGTQSAAWLIRSHTIGDILGIGGAIVALSGVLEVALAVWGYDTPVAVVAPVAVFMIGVGLILPQAIAGALAPFPDAAGTAASLFGFIQMAMGAAVGAAVGGFHDGTQMPMVIAICLSGGASLAAYFLIARPAFQRTTD
jgi:MFS transporter, DHA1 family, multidrug resistance protein